MKKIILSTLVISALFIMSTNAQDLKSKKGETILPEKSDWAISVSANPFLNYFGAFMSTAGGVAPKFDFLGADKYIVGKYFVDEKTAYRAKVGIGLGSKSVTTLVQKLKADGTNDGTATVEDVVKTSNTDITLGAGIEKRKGNTRLQGFYGAEALINLGGGKVTKTYGNPINAGNTGTHTLESKAGSTFGISARAFIGAEYFVLPKFSIGAEYGWGLGLSSTGEGSVKSESWDGTAVVSKETKTGKQSNFGIGVDISPVIVLTLHF